jgi:hypothetical protein
MSSSVNHASPAAGAGGRTRTSGNNHTAPTQRAGQSRGASNKITPATPHNNAHHDGAGCVHWLKETSASHVNTCHRSCSNQAASLKK